MAYIDVEEKKGGYIMKESAHASPFAALSPQEQKEQWIWWQCQHPAAVQEKPLQLTETPARSVNTQPAPLPTHHGQYRAVLHRMQIAGQHANAYKAWPEDTN